MIAMHRRTSAAAQTAAPAFAPKKRVLLVEDQDLLRWYASEILVDEGYEVAEASNAASAFRLLMQEQFDLLVTDIDLGGGPDGFELARAATRAAPGLPVIYASGRTHFGEADRAPGSRFVAKPYAPAELLGAAAAALDIRPGEDVRRFA